MSSNSQAGQDIFAYTMTNKKQNGYFLEIGANHPIAHNNTYVLEKEYNWRGLMVEYDVSFEESYKTYRPNSIYQIMDARNVNYRKILDEKAYPENMDYLQIDLDVDNRSTLDTLILLNNTVFDKYKFATVTFEHDIYSGDFYNTQTISREIFKNRGYVLVFPNVSVFWQGEFKPFEDWYVHPELVNLDYVNSIITDRSLNCDEIKNILLQ
jgi:hypothetical protein